MGAPAPRYDRELLLNGVKRNAILELSEVQQYGIDSYGDADYVCVYGMRPSEWHARGVRLLGRTAVECTRDALAGAIARDVAAVVAMAPEGGAIRVVDPFAGSANTLYWLTRGLSNARGIGFDLDPEVHRLTKRNLATLGLPVEVVLEDYRRGLAALALAEPDLLVAFIAPPWGDALDPLLGLDLRRTQPPIGDIVEFLFDTFAHNPILCAVQVVERLDADSLAALERRFDWSALSMYALNAPGQNHGILLGARGWRPDGQRRAVAD